MDISDKLATQVTQDEENQIKNTTQYVLDTTTYSVNMTWTLQQTTGDDDFWCLTPLSEIFQLYHGDQF
jgi:hypothetical protein